MQLMENDKTKFDKDHRETLFSIRFMAMTYRKHGKWEETEQLDLQTMETYNTQVGEDHPDTASSMARPAMTF